MEACRLLRVTAALVLLPMAVCADEFDDRVRKITFATPASDVVALMQRQPDAEEITTIVGVPKTRWRWSVSNGRTVIVVLIGNRVVMTKICIAVPNC
jgi:hypothetical protein